MRHAAEPSKIAPRPSRKSSDYRDSEDFTIAVFFQEKNTDPIRPIVAGRYHDRFEKVDGRWRFEERDYTKTDLVGDISGHTRVKM